MKASIDRTDREKDEVMQQSEPEERQRIRGLMQDVHISYQAVSEAYTDRHR